MSSEEPTLYGLQNINRSNEELWGKNQFNTAFPMALACYMRDKTSHDAVYFNVNDNLEIVSDEISINDLFDVESSIPSSDIRFEFEKRYEPYSDFSYDDIGGIDCVVKHDEVWKRAIEIKLTVVPDSSTKHKNESEWGPELVVRPQSTWYCALGIAYSLKKNNRLDALKELVEPVGQSIQHWDNKTEIKQKIEIILDTLDSFQKQFRNFQQPFLLQPIWKTQGDSPRLSKNAFDLFVWSDFALCRLFIDRARKTNRGITRPVRSSVRLLRFLYEITRGGQVGVEEIFTEMSYGKQTDKAFAFSGSVMNGYMRSQRLETPILERNVVASIILNGGQEKLSPERRFDQSIYFTAAELFESSTENTSD